MNATIQVPVDGRSARWAHHRAERRLELLDVARHLIHEKGPDVTMEDIAAASGTSKSIVYRYFEDKAHLQRALGRSILTTMHGKLLDEMRLLEDSVGREPDADERIRAMIRAYVETAQRSPGVYRFVTRPSDGLNHFLDAVSRLISTFLPAEIPAPRIWAHGAVGFVERAVDVWMTAHENAEEPAGDGTTDLQAESSGTPTSPLTGVGTDADPAPLTSDQLVTHLVSWLMKGLHS